MIGRLVQADDFQRLLATPPVRRSAHFLLHHLRARPLPPKRPARLQAASVQPAEFSTADEPKLSTSVDNFLSGLWLGCVVPKRHARRAVTRNTLKRQMRAAAERHETGLAPGLWLVRLRQGFATAQFPSADSGALRAAARAELDQLFRLAAR